MLKFVKSFLEKLAKENEKSFGTGRLDCCDLNKLKKTSTQAANGTSGK